MSTSLRYLRNRRLALSLATTANQLTILRIVFVPVFLILLVYNELGWALGTFVLAGITDVLDGLIARRFGQKTSIGAALDPLADKLLMTSSIAVRCPARSTVCRMRLIRVASGQARTATTCEW